MQIEALTTQLRKMQCKLKQKRHMFDVTEILKRHNFEADVERGDANQGISVYAYVNALMFAYFSTLTLLKFISQNCIFSVNTEICCYNSKHVFITLHKAISAVVCFE